MKRPLIIILLTVALTLVFVGIVAVLFFRFNGGFPSNHPFDVRNIPSTLEESKALKVDTEKPVTLTVTSAAGDVTVTGADVQEVEVRAIKTAYDSTQARADEEVKSVRFTVEQTGNTITITYELPQSMNFSNNVNTVDFIVTVPKEATVDVDTGFGEISVAGTLGDVDVENDFGDVTAQNIEGALRVENNSGTIEATSIKASNKDIFLNSDFGNMTLDKASARNITLDSNSGALTLVDVTATGELSTKSDFGDTKFENGSAASIDLDSNSGRVELIKVRVTRLIKVVDDFGDITLTQVNAASYDLHTNSGTITVDGAKGDLKAHTDFGNIDITSAESVTLDLDTNSGSIEFEGALGEGPHLVNSDFGNITLLIPADSKLSVDLNTDFGNIKSDIPVTVTLTEGSDSSGEEIAGSMNGGGDQLTVHTNSGSITINAMK